MSDNVVQNEANIEEKLDAAKDPNDEAFMKKMKGLLLLLRIIFGLAFFISVVVIFFFLAK